MGSYAPKQTEKRSLHAGETPRQAIKRELDDSHVRLFPGRLWVSEELISKAGKPYRVVTLSFKDGKGEDCRLKKMYFEGQTYLADEFVPYNDHHALLTVTGVDEEHVEQEPKKRGDGVTHVYTVKGDFFLSPFNVLRPGSRSQQQPQPASPPPTQQTFEPTFDSEPLPDEIFQDLPAPAPAVMDGGQLARERARYMIDIVKAFSNEQERSAFLELLPYGENEELWQEQDLPLVQAALVQWIEGPPSEENPICRANWNAPYLERQKKEVESIINNSPVIQERPIKVTQAQRDLVQIRNKMTGDPKKRFEQMLAFEIEIVLQRMRAHLAAQRPAA